MITTRNVWDMIFLFIGVVVFVISIVASLLAKQNFAPVGIGVLFLTFVRFLHGVWINYFK